jgi:DNA-binding NarL/FixJ family response regulator
MGKARELQTTVLIVDDHSAIREGLKSVLRDSREFTVAGEAEDAEHAMSLVDSLRPGIVILDISIPGLSGIRVAEKIRHVSPATRIVVYTMHAELGLQTGMAEAGASAYVLKGEPLARLLDALRATRDGKTLVPESAAVSGEAEQDLRNLSRREREIFLMLAEGRSIKQAAFDLGLSPKTVETYKYRLMRKLNIDNVVDLAKMAIRTRLVEP